MATGSTKYKSKVAQASRYKTNKTWEVNRTLRLERTIRNQPNNEQAKAALKAGFVYRRKTPNTRPWSASWIRIAKLFKEFTGSFNPLIMSSNPKTASEAMQITGAKSLTYAKMKAVKPTGDKGFFSIEARLQGTR
jgi:hypothetical protein